MKLEHHCGEAENAPLRFLMLCDTNDGAACSRVVPPGDFELRIPRLMQPLPEEPREISVARTLHHVLEIFTRCVRVTVGLVVSSQPAEET